MIKLENMDMKVSSDEYQYLGKSLLPSYHFQKSLPRLPIPDLEKTCSRYINALQPLLSKEQFEKTKKIVEKFSLEEGKDLQEKLFQYDELKKNTSYMSDIWRDVYLTYRGSISRCISSYGLTVIKSGNLTTQAAVLVISSLRFMKTIDAERMEPHLFHLNPQITNNDTFFNYIEDVPAEQATMAAYQKQVFPIDMSQHVNRYKSCRIAEKGRDTIYKDPKARHVVVIRRGRFYVFDVLDESGNIYAPNYYIESFAKILADDRPVVEYSPGVLTSTDNRDEWAELRKHMQDIGNKDNLDLIESACFVICFDESDIQNLDEDYLSGLFRNLNNRWFDKIYTIIMNKKGHHGVIFEHSILDGASNKLYCDSMFQDITRKSESYLQAGNGESSATVKVKSLDFILDDSLRVAIKNTEEKSYEAVKNLEINTMTYNKFGKELIKEKHLSPDSVIQLAFQMAIFQMSGKTVSTYESSTTSTFLHGRTETMRPCTMATKECVDAFYSTIDKPTKSNLMQLIRNCTKKHTVLVREAAAGQGFDRHLLGLMCMAKANNIETKLFADPSFALLNSNILTTTTIDSKFGQGFTYGPVVPESLGISYAIENDLVTFVTSAYKNFKSATHFNQLLRQSLDHIYDALQSDGQTMEEHSKI